MLIVVAFALPINMPISWPVAVTFTFSIPKLVIVPLHTELKNPTLLEPVIVKLNILWLLPSKCPENSLIGVNSFPVQSISFSSTKHPLGFSLN